jgi:hypothetical protein
MEAGSRRWKGAGFSQETDCILIASGLSQTCKTAVLRRRFACPVGATKEKYETSQNRILDAAIAWLLNFSFYIIIVRTRIETDARRLQYKTGFGTFKILEQVSSSS